MNSRLILWPGILLHLALGLYPLAALGLLAPLWAVAAMYVVWAGTGLAAWRLGREHPWAPLGAVITTLVVLQVFLLIGDRALGWTA